MLNNNINPIAVSIMIVEDEPSSSLMLKSMLSKSGYTVLDIVETGEDAVAKCDELRPDLVLMDIQLGGKLDGIETAKEIWKRYGIPFVYITAGTNDEDFQRAKESLPFGYLLKPYSQNLLSATIELALYKFTMETNFQEIVKRNKDIVASIPDKSIYLNLDGSFHSSHDADLAKSILNQAVIEKMMPLVGKAITTGEIQHYDYKLIKGEKEYFYEARILISTDDKVLINLRDITERKKAQLELEKYKSHLEQMIEQRTKELAGVNQNLKDELKKSRNFQLNFKLFKHAIEQSPDVVVMIRKSGKIEYVNNRFCELHGYSFNEVVGGNVTSPNNKVFPEPEMWEKIIKQSEWRGELYGLNKNGELIYMNSYITEIKDEDGNITHYILVSEDITENKKQELLLEKARESLENTDIEILNKDLDWQEWKDKMISRNITRTDKSLFRNIYNSFTQGAGFGSLLTLIEMLKTTSKKDDGKYIIDSNLVDMIINNAATAQDAFKTFSSIDYIISNEFTQEKISFGEFYDFIKAIILKASELAKIKDQRIILNDLNPVFKKTLFNINKEYFYKALYEGLINALKYSKNRTYIIVITTIVNRNVSIAIINEPEKGDEGIVGIPVEYEKIIFEPFYRLSKIVHEQYKTLDFGLGLTLIEKIINRHGGEVMLKNILDHSDIKRDPQLKVSLLLTIPVASEKIKG